MEGSKTKRNKSNENRASLKLKPGLAKENSKNKAEIKTNPKGKINLKARITNSNSMGMINSNDVEDGDSESSFEKSDYDFLSSEVEDESEQTQPKKKKKASVKHGSTEFAATLAHLISQPPGSLTSQVPVLSKSKGVAAKIEEGRLEYKARKILAAERKKILDKDHIRFSPMTMDYEKKLRSIATRGVIMIFNAMQTQQRTTDLDDLTSSAEKAEVTKMSKASFLSMLKSGSVPSK